MRAFILMLMGLALQGQAGTDVIAATGVIEGYVVRAKAEPPMPLVNARLELNTDQGLASVRILPVDSCSQASVRDAIAFESQRTDSFARNPHARQWVPQDFR